MSSDESLGKREAEGPPTSSPPSSSNKHRKVDSLVRHFLFPDLVNKGKQEREKVLLSVLLQKVGALVSNVPPDLKFHGPFPWCSLSCPTTTTTTPSSSSHISSTDAKMAVLNAVQRRDCLVAALLIAEEGVSQLYDYVRDLSERDQAMVLEVPPHYHNVLIFLPFDTTAFREVFYYVHDRIVHTGHHHEDFLGFILYGGALPRSPALRPYLMGASGSSHSATSNHHPTTTTANPSHGSSHGNGPTSRAPAPAPSSSPDSAPIPAPAPPPPPARSSPPARAPSSPPPATSSSNEKEKKRTSTSGDGGGSSSSANGGGRTKRGGEASGERSSLQSESRDSRRRSQESSRSPDRDRHGRSGRARSGSNGRKGQTSRSPSRGNRRRSRSRSRSHERKGRYDGGKRKSCCYGSDCTWDNRNGHRDQMAHPGDVDFNKTIMCNGGNSCAKPNCPFTHPDEVESLNIKGADVDHSCFMGNACLDRASCPLLHPGDKGFVAPEKIRCFKSLRCHVEYCPYNHSVKNPDGTVVGRGGGRSSGASHYSSDSRNKAAPSTAAAPSSTNRSSAMPKERKVEEDDNSDGGWPDDDDDGPPAKAPARQPSSSQAPSSSSKSSGRGWGTERPGYVRPQPPQPSAAKQDHYGGGGGQGGLAPNGHEPVAVPIIKKERGIADETATPPYQPTPPYKPHEEQEIIDVDGDDADVQFFIENLL